MGLDLLSVSACARQLWRIGNAGVAGWPLALYIGACPPPQISETYVLNVLFAPAPNAGWTYEAPAPSASTRGITAASVNGYSAPKMSTHRLCTQ